MFRHQPQTGCHLCDARHPGGRVVRLLPATPTSACGTAPGSARPTSTTPPSISPGSRTSSTRSGATCSAALRLGRHRRRGADRPHALRAHVVPGGAPVALRPLGPRHPHPLRPGEAQDYVGFSTSKLYAAVYPEAIALAPLIASPYWRRLAGRTEAEQARFFAEVAGRVTYPYSPPDRSADAVAHWALADWRPPSRPLTTYTPGRVRGTLPGVAANRLVRHGTKRARCGSAGSVGTRAARSSSIATSNRFSCVTAHPST